MSSVKDKREREREREREGGDTPKDVTRSLGMVPQCHEWFWKVLKLYESCMEGVGMKLG
jgi:hypothetical protein